MADNESKIPCDERRQESIKTKKKPDPKTVLVASGMDDEMESLAINLAIDAISLFRNEKMKVAKYIASRFEAKYGAPWHCIVSDGHMRFYVRYDADDHIFFAINGITIFLFRLHMSKSRPLINRLYRRLSDASMKVESPRDDVHVISTGMQLPMQHYALRLTDDAIVEFPNEKMIIAHFITTRFAAQYGGGNWHCVVSDGRLGYEVRHHSEDHIFFSVGSLTILLFREEDVKNATIKSPHLKPRKLSASMQLPTKIISSCMDMGMQQFAVTIAVQGIEMKFRDEKMQIAQLLMQRFDERFGAPWHCIVGDQPLGFYARYDQQNYIYFCVEPFTILLFKHQKQKLFSEEVSDDAKEVALVEGEGNTNKELLVIDSGLDKSMDEKATLFAREAMNRFPKERMLIAHYIMRRLESQFGPPWHCVVSEGSLGYSTHQAMEYGDEIVLAPDNDLPATTPTGIATAEEKSSEPAATAKEGKDEMPQPEAPHEETGEPHEPSGDTLPPEESPQEPVPETNNPPEPAPQPDHEPIKEPEREPHVPLDEAGDEPRPLPSEPAAVPEGPVAESEHQIPSHEREVPEPQGLPQPEPQQHNAAKPEADHPAQQDSYHPTQPEPQYPVQPEPHHPLQPEPKYPAKPEPHYPIQPEPNQPPQHEPHHPTQPQPCHPNQPEPHQPPHPEPHYPTQPEPHPVHPDPGDLQHDFPSQPVPPPSDHPQPHPDPYRDNVPLPVKPGSVQIIATGMNPEMQQYAVGLAQEAIANSPNQMMPIAQYLMTRFEQKYGAPWHCVVSDGQLGFYVRYDPAGHIYFAIGSTTIFLFRNQNP